MFFRTKSLQYVGGFDERYFLYMEDTDLTKSINQYGNAIFSPDFEVIHEWQRGNHSLSGARLMITSMVKYFNKWGWRLF
ncbi:glycosyltransferase family 2 protein [Leuconostoc citreum]